MNDDNSLIQYADDIIISLKTLHLFDLEIKAFILFKYYLPIIYFYDNSLVINLNELKLKSFVFKA